MKKFLGILAVAAVFASCDNAGDSAKRTQDSLDSVKREDSMRNAMPAPAPAPTMSGDSAGMMTPAPTMGDSAGKMMSGDTMSKK